MIQIINEVLKTPRLENASSLCHTTFIKRFPSELPFSLAFPLLCQFNYNALIDCCIKRSSDKTIK